MQHNVNNNSQIKEKEIKVKESKVELEESKKIYDADLEKIQKILIETIGSTNITVTQEVISYLDDLPVDVIEYALKKTARKGARWDYAQSILNDYIQKNLKTLDLVKVDDIAFKNKNNINTPNSYAETEEREKILQEAFKDGS